MNDRDIISISIDPYTGRNPSYCFVELNTKQQADRAIKEVSGKNVLGRPVRLELGVTRRVAKRRVEATGCKQTSPTFDHWTRTDASKYWKGYNEKGRRLVVGGLPQMADHGTVDKGVRELFKDYKL